MAQAKDICDQFPGIGDGLFFEIVSKGEITQHFEKRMVAGRIADIVQIIVLAAGADTFLTGGGAGVVPDFSPGEDIFKLHHARIGEQQGRIIVGHERAGGHDAVVFALKKVQKCGPNFIQTGHAACPLFLRY